MREEFSMRLGVPLNDRAFSEMTEEERAFWEDFLEEAFRVVREKKATDETMPFTPPSSLKEKYDIAITEHDGQKYCQVRQLQSVFAF